MYKMKKEWRWLVDKLWQDRRTEGKEVETITYLKTKRVVAVDLGHEERLRTLPDLGRQADMIEYLIGGR